MSDVAAAHTTGPGQGRTVFVHSQVRIIKIYSKIFHPPKTGNYHEAVIAVCKRIGVAQVIAYSAEAGIGRTGMMRRSSFWSTGPVVIMIVVPDDRLSTLILALKDLLTNAVVTVSSASSIQAMLSGKPSELGSPGRPSHV
jgi:PII-like signaling protein